MFASTCENLPPEIIEAILHRLPAKSVGRFKSVSKTWRSLVSDPTFIKTHLHLRFHQTTKLIFFSKLGNFVYSVHINQLLPYLNTNNNYDIDIFATAKKLTLGSFPMKWVEILGSCNGLVLAKDVKGRIFLMNPTTITQEQELWEAPPTPFQHTDRYYSVCCGFGYDSITDDYKVVWISYPKHNGDTYISLYSLRKNSWKKLPNPPRAFENCSGALVNHSYHWLASSKTEVIVFSFADEVFSDIKLPDVFQNRNIQYPKVVEIGGKLGFFVDGCELWVMHEYGNSKSWIKVFSRVFRFVAIPVCSVEGSNHRHIMVKNIITANDIVVFNIDKNICRNVRIVGGPSGFYVRGTFVESIESPKRVITTP